MPDPVVIQEPPSHRGPLYIFGRIVCRTWVDLWFDLKAYGIDNVPDSGGVLIVSNHQSYLDPVILGVKTRRTLSYLAKSELFENPFVGWMISNLNAFPVRQGDGDIGAVKETIRRLQEGHALNVFPEGTRSLTGEISPMQPGVGLIAKRAGVPVVPAAIYGSYQAWPKDAKLWRSHPIRVKYGKPLNLKDMKASQIVQEVDRSIRGLFDDLRKMDKHDGR